MFFETLFATSTGVIRRTYKGGYPFKVLKSMWNFEMPTLAFIFAGLLIVCPRHDAAKTKNEAPVLNCYGEPNRQFRCANGLTCVPMSARCDKEKSCPDGSDEWDCQEQQCAEGEHRCKTGKCIPMWFVCDSKDDCKDGSGWWQDADFLPSDEDSKCGHHEATDDIMSLCYKHSFWCKEDEKGYGCTSWYNLCDGKWDCYRGTDEKGCKDHHCLHRDDHRCDESRCVASYFVCDGVRHCLDGSDEKDCNCLRNQFRCANGQCIPSFLRCNGYAQCEDKSDEVGCEKNKCNEAREFRCGNGQCIAKEGLCDKVSQCSDATDEWDCDSPAKGRKCTGNSIECPASHECYSKFGRCDGSKDCRDGSDEWHCDQQNRCPDGWHRCSSGRCVVPARVCDGRIDCEDDYSDEKNCD